MNEFLSRSENELLEIIGENVDDGSLVVFPIPKTKAELREKATAWLEEQRTTLHDAIRDLSRNGTQRFLIEAWRGATTWLGRPKACSAFLTRTFGALDSR